MYATISIAAVPEELCKGLKPEDFSQAEHQETKIRVPKTEQPDPDK